jgi:hypothetical protein
LGKPSDGHFGFGVTIAVVKIPALERLFADNSVAPPTTVCIYSYEVKPSQDGGRTNIDMLIFRRSPPFSIGLEAIANVLHTVTVGAETNIT